MQRFVTSSAKQYLTTLVFDGNTHISLSLLVRLVQSKELKALGRPSVGVSISDEESIAAVALSLTTSEKTNTSLN